MKFWIKVVIIEVLVKVINVNKNLEKARKYYIRVIPTQNFLVWMA